MNLRITPELSFVYDESITYGAHISKLLSQAMPTEGSEEAEESEDTEISAEGPDDE